MLGIEQRDALDVWILACSSELALAATHTCVHSHSIPLARPICSRCAHLAIFRFRTHCSSIKMSAPPQQMCNATLQMLREDGYKLIELCPLCDDFGVKCKVGFHRNQDTSSSSAGQSHAHSRTFTHTHLHFDHILVADRHDQLDIIIICPTTFSLYHSFTLFAILHLCSSSPPYRFHSHSHVRSVVMNSLYLYDMAWYGRMKLCHIKHKLC